MVTTRSSAKRRSNGPAASDPEQPPAEPPPATPPGAKGHAAARPGGLPRWLRFGGEKLDGDRHAVALLLLLYTLQGVPMGLSASVSLMLQERNVTYADQGTFSLASWPFSLKVLWAPVVDSVYSARFGQRRTWVLPLQLTVGLVLLYASAHIGELLSDAGADVPRLTAVFFALYVLLASQDIAVDGWALTLLSERNVGLAGTCNAVGQTLGTFLAFTGYFVLQNFGAVGLRGYMTFWGAAFVASAACVALTTEGRPQGAPGVAAAYQQAAAVCRLPAVWRLAAVLLTRHVAFVAAENLVLLKLVEKGLPKEHVSVLSALLTPVSILLPVAVSRVTAGARPLDAMTRTFAAKSVLGGLAGLLVWGAPATLGREGAPLPVGYYAGVLGWLVAYTAIGTVHFVACMSFFSRVADESLGGTYMTLLNTLSNLGSKWCGTLVFYAFDAAARRACAGAGEEKCAESDGALYAVLAASTAAGLIWLRVFGNQVDKLQSLPLDKWAVPTAAWRDSSL